MNILFVEDNKTISKGLVYSLEENGYAVTLCETYEEALETSPFDFDLAIIDISLPDGNGFELYREIKRLSDVRTVFLTALDDEDSIVKAFDLGADDYITKPFSMRELLARVRRLIGSRSNAITVGDIVLDLEKKTVHSCGDQVELTALEFKIFSMLVQNAGKVVTRDIILEKIWDIAGNYVNDNTLTVYIKRIRKKLGTDCIKTVKGLGYKFEPSK
ncbi:MULTISPECIES: response regulator transcription factor [unclassified Ruminococcus]|uniref:response regulator transcription factor n=1 Tax=unclassified Ruminococcus TaxID=2608920 RepID=UPI00210D57BB|nr:MULTISPECIES: response regulator transcription factor [unclassified Ruminococcus]MCQ4023378.1 response regulator [Ruminococcus sp. zg-924]MCQ4115745.1 response regulator [Ruminococcus sp. zg-921]